MYFCRSGTPLLQSHFELALVLADDSSLQALDYAVVDLLNILDILELFRRLSRLSFALATLLLRLLLADFLHDRSWDAAVDHLRLRLLVTGLLHHRELCLGLSLSSERRLFLLLSRAVHLLHLDERDVEVLLRGGRHADLGH